MRWLHLKETSDLTGDIMSSLQEYERLFEKLDLCELSVEEEGLKLTLKKNVSAVPQSIPPVHDAKALSETDHFLQTASEEISGEEIKAPLLGIFYANEVPLKEGDTVQKGDVLCSIEAMKMMNEVRSTAEGKVLKINAQNGGLVEFHQTLFVIG